MDITVFLLLSILGLCTVVAVKRPVAGVAVYLIIYMIINPYVWWGSQIVKILVRPSYAAALILFFSCLLNINQLNWNISRREMEIYIFVVAAFVVSYLFGIGVHANAFKYLEKMLKLSFFLFLLFRAVHRFSDFNIVIWVLILGAVFLAWQARLIGGYSGDGRLDNIGGPDFHEANAFAAFLLINLIFLGFKLLKTSWWKMLLEIFGIAFLFNAIVMTQSRAAFIGLSIGFCFVLIKSPKKFKKQIIIYALLGISLLGILASEQFWERMGTIDNESQKLETSHQGIPSEENISRVDFWKSSIKIFKDHPMGIGVKNFEQIVPYYDSRNPGRDVHNTYALCYSEIGIIGITLFLIIIIEAFLQLKRIKLLAEKSINEFEYEMTEFALTTVLIVFLTGPMVTHSYLYSEFLWILLSLPICLENAIKHQMAIQNK